MDSLDVLNDLLHFVLEKVRTHPCTCCQVGSLAQPLCQRCALLASAGRAPRAEPLRPSEDPLYLEARRRCDPEAVENDR